MSRMPLIPILSVCLLIVTSCGNTDNKNHLLQEQENGWLYNASIPAMDTVFSDTFYREVKEARESEEDPDTDRYGGYESFLTWDDMQDYLGIRLWNPLEFSDDLTDANFAATLMTGDVNGAGDEIYHSIIHWNSDEQDQITGWSFQTGYRLDSVGVIVFAQAFADEQESALVAGKMSGETVESDVINIEGIGSVPTLHHYFNNGDQRNLYFEKEGMLYTITVMGTEEAEVKNAFDQVVKLLE